MFKHEKQVFLLFEDLSQPMAKVIWYLDSAYQSSWKALYFSNSYALIH